jgi:hypothetical protein
LLAETIGGPAYSRPVMNCTGGLQPEGAVCSLTGDAGLAALDEDKACCEGTAEANEKKEAEINCWNARIRTKPSGR